MAIRPRCGVEALDKDKCGYKTREKQVLGALFYRGWPQKAGWQFGGHQQEEKDGNFVVRYSQTGIPAQQNLSSHFCLMKFRECNSRQITGTSVSRKEVKGTSAGKDLLSLLLLSPLGGKAPGFSFLLDFFAEL